MKTTWLLVGVLALGGCRGNKGSAADRAVCEQAADRWVGCMRELGGDALAREAERKRDIGACAEDGRTVAMYRACLPEPTCEALMACIDRVVGAGP